MPDGFAQALLKGVQKGLGGELQVKLCRYQWNGHEAIGAVLGDTIHPLDCAFDTLDDLVRSGAGYASAIARRAETIPLSRVRLLAPLTRPQKIVAIGSNFPRPDAGPTVGGLPVLFFKPPSTLCGPQDPLLLPPEADLVIGEVELAVVIGKSAERIAPDQAEDHVFGYMVANDVTAPQILLGESAQNPLYLQQSRGKGFKTFCPIGPWIVTADELPFPPAVALEQRVDDLLEIAGRTEEMTVPLADLIADASCAFGLEAGDVLLTGSPPPLAGKRMPLVEGAVLRSAISGIGALANPVRRL